MHGLVNPIMTMIRFQWKEISRVVELAQAYEIVKIISVGNEADVTNCYYVQPKVILHWVNHLQQLKRIKNSQNLWITSS